MPIAIILYLCVVKEKETLPHCAVDDGIYKWFVTFVLVIFSAMKFEQLLLLMFQRKASIEPSVEFENLLAILDHDLANDASLWRC